MNKERVHYRIAEYTIAREEQLDSLGNYRMFWVLRKGANFLYMSKTKEDMILEMMIWTCDAMEA
tara:strand:+ start:512 stop:703 length:192 start_codon:yes stop_codon:yes gene_type:complete